MFTYEQHLENLVRHIELVKNACLLLGKRLIDKGRREFGRILIANGFVHDASKFSGVEWEYLHAGPDVPKDKLELAIHQHVTTNQHHPEYWGGIEQMPEIAVAEMVTDWYARSTEFGSGLRDWIKSTAVSRFKIDVNGEQYAWINSCVNLLLEDSFSRNTSEGESC